MPAAATLLWLPFVKPEGWPATPLLVVELGAFFVLAVAIHGTLAADRPDASHLTRFYLILTAGGALGTAFVAMLAPTDLLDDLRVPDPHRRRPRRARAAAGRDAGRTPERLRLGPVLAGGAVRLAPYAAAGTLLVLLIDARQPAAAADVRNLLLIGGIVVFAAVTPRILATAAPLTFVVLIALTSASPLVRTRNFFGVVEVRDTANYHAEYSGTTLHGLQYTDARRGEPTTYYSRVGPLGDVFDDLRIRTSGAKIGVVGLGVGTIAAYARPGDDLTFYEINPAVVDIARDPAYFTYLSDAPVTPRVVVGDGRLSLEDQPAGSFDLLVLDAFSSDTVPAHLLTREAIETYARTLRPGGVLAFHLSNRYYSLTGPVAATARAGGLAALTRGFTPDAARSSSTAPPARAGSSPASRTTSPASPPTAGTPRPAATSSPTTTPTSPVHSTSPASESRPWFCRSMPEPPRYTAATMDNVTTVLTLDEAYACMLRFWRFSSPSCTTPRSLTCWTRAASSVHARRTIRASVGYSWLEAVGDVLRQTTARKHRLSNHAALHARLRGGVRIPPQATSTTTHNLRAGYALRRRRQPYDLVERRSSEHAAAHHHLTIALAVLGGAFFVVERVWPAVPDLRHKRTGRRTDVAWYFFNATVTKIVSPIIIGVLVIVGARFVGQHLTGDDLRALTRRDTPVSNLPLPLQFALLLVIADFIGYWSHRLFHFDPRLWRIHAIHHSSRQVDWLAAVRVHPFNDVVTNVVQALPLLLIGFDFQAFGGYVALLTIFAIFLHSNVPWSYGRFRYVIASPVFHRWHHTTERRASTRTSPASCRCGICSSAPSTCRKAASPWNSASSASRSRTASGASSSTRSAPAPSSSATTPDATLAQHRSP